MLVMTDGEETAKILDFGIAKLIDLDSNVKLTQTGDIFGTPLYMSPEQLKGEEVDARSDIYALGATWYQCLAGVPPHEGESAFAIMHKRLAEKPLPLDQHGKRVSGELERIIMKCLALDPNRRYRSAGELFTDIDRYEHSHIFEQLLRAWSTKVRVQVTGANPPDKKILRAAGIFALIAIILVTWFVVHQLKISEKLDCELLIKEAAQIVPENDSDTGKYQQRYDKYAAALESVPDSNSRYFNIKKAYILEHQRDCLQKLHSSINFDAKDGIDLNDDTLVPRIVDLQILTQLVSLALDRQDDFQYLQYGQLAIREFDALLSYGDRQHAEALRSTGVAARKEHWRKSFQAYQAAFTYYQASGLKDPNITGKLEVHSTNFLDAVNHRPDGADAIIERVALNDYKSVFELLRKERHVAGNTERIGKAHYYFGIFKSQQNQFSEAVGEFRKAIELLPVSGLGDWRSRAPFLCFDEMVNASLKSGKPEIVSNVKQWLKKQVHYVEAPGDSPSWTEWHKGLAGAYLAQLIWQSDHNAKQEAGKYLEEALPLLINSYGQIDATLPVNSGHEQVVKALDVLQQIDPAKYTVFSGEFAKAEKDPATSH
jgi:tetratricopeptide (TPR) repeat protein